MKNLNLFTIAVLLLAITSCKKFEIYGEQVFRAEISNEGTKTAISDDFKKINWDLEDKIGIFDYNKSTPVEAGVSSLGEDLLTAVFTPVSQVAQPVFAFHPYASDCAGIESEGLWINTDGATGSFSSANIMVALPDENNFLSFKNVVGIFRILISDPLVRKLEVDAPGITGKLHVSFQNGLEITADEQDKDDEITIDIKETGEYYIPVRPGEYEAGTLHIKTLGEDDEVINNITYAKKLTISRNQLINWGDPSNRPEASLTNITCANESATFDAATSTFTLTLPGVTDFSKVILSFNYNGKSLKANGKEIESGKTEIDASAVEGSRDGEYLVNLIGDNNIKYNLIIRNPGLPVVTVTSPGGETANKVITSEDVWTENISLRVDRANGETIFKTDPEAEENKYCQMKGRGNSTWKYFDKKPYAIKLDKKASLLDGGNKGKRWILLANFKDRTLLRNDAAFWLSRKSGLAYTVNGMFVELVFNGEYRGCYYLCEQIRIDKKRVNITEMEDFEDGKATPENLTGGYLLEADWKDDEGKNAFKPSTNAFLYDSKFYYNVKSPDVDVTSPEALNYIKQYLYTLEGSLSDNTNHSYENYLDVDSAVDFFFLQELTSNDDFYNSGIHSTYLYKDRGGKIFLGPIWDFDYSTFIPSRSNFWSCLETSDKGTAFVFYYEKLMKDSKFRNRLVERWNEYKTSYRGLPDYIDEVAETIRLAEQYNHRMWPQHPNVTQENENGEAEMTFDEALANVKSGFIAKWNWIDQNIDKIK